MLAVSMFLYNYIVYSVSSPLTLYMPLPRPRKGETVYYISQSDHRHTCVLSGWLTTIGVPASDVSLIIVCSGTSPDVGNRTSKQ